MNRRRFLAGAAGFGVGLLRAQPQPHRIDVHHHLFPPDYRTALAAMNLASPPPWTPQQSLDDMGKGGIATSLLSVSTPGVWFGDVQQGRKLARVINEYGAKLAAENPGKFGLFAAIPLPDPEGSLREIEYAFGTLKAQGIGLMTSYQVSGSDRWLGDASFGPVWEELNRRKAVVYTHPDTPACCGAIKDEVGPGVIEWATATTRTMTSLLFSGTAAKYPDIRWIFSHGGGTVPFLLSRFIRQESDMKEQARVKLPNGVLYELKKFYYDTAQANHPGALAALLKLAPVPRILYGTDYPFRTVVEENDGLAAQHFATEDLFAIEQGNAKRLLNL